MTGLDRDYYRRRLGEEIAIARITSCAVARGVHLELAGLYSAKLRLIDALSTGPHWQHSKAEALAGHGIPSAMALR